jgi:hypothetical protein
MEPSFQLKQPQPLVERCRAGRCIRVRSLGRDAEAIASYRKSGAILQPFLNPQNRSPLVQVLSAEQSLALLFRALSDYAAAASLERNSPRRAPCNSGRPSLSPVY